MKKKIWIKIHFHFQAQRTGEILLEMKQLKKNCKISKEVKNKNFYFLLNASCICFDV